MYRTERRLVGNVMMCSCKMPMLQKLTPLQSITPLLKSEMHVAAGLSARSLGLSLIYTQH
jgi:hypothetical protein